MFAVLKTGGKQYRVQAGDVLRVERIAAQAGENVQFNEILMVGGDAPMVGTPTVADAGVQAEVIDQIKAKKVLHYVKRRRKHSSQRTKGHRQKLTMVRITDILPLARKRRASRPRSGPGRYRASPWTPRRRPALPSPGRWRSTASVRPTC